MRHLGKILILLLVAGGLQVGQAQSRLSDDTGLPLPEQLPNVEELGLPFPNEHFAPPEYEQYPQNWDITQDGRGIVYVANNDGILEYDGESWRLIPTATNTFVRSLDTDAEGTVFAGTVGDFGYLKPDSIGVKRYVSLHDEVPSLHKSFGDVWGTHATSEGVYFQANERIFRWDGRDITVWTSDDGFHTSFVVRDEFYVRDFERGLLKMVADSLQQVPSGEFFGDIPIHMMVPYPDEKILVGTSEDGLYLYDGKRLTPFQTEATPFLDEHELYHGSLLSDGHVALATIGGGVLIIDQQGRLVRVLGPSSELADGVVHYVHEDSEGGLWMAFNNSGIARAAATAPLSTYDESLGLDGVVYSIERHQGSLFVATGAGLFVLDEEPLTLAARKQGERTAFRRVDGIPILWDLVSTEHGLLAATEKGTFLLDENRWERLTQGTQHTARTIVPSDHHDDWYFVGGRQGVTALHATEGGWRVHVIAGVDRETHSLAEAQDGALWLGTAQGSIMRLRFDGAPSTGAAIDQFGRDEALPQGFKRVMSATGEVLVLSKEGVFSMQAPSQPGHPSSGADHASIQFRPDDRFQIESFDAPLLGLAHARGDELLMMRGSRVYHGRKRAAGGYEWDEIRDLRFPKPGVVPIHMEGGGVLWMGNQRELIRFDPNWAGAPDAPFATYVRQVTALQDRAIIYGGAVPDAARRGAASSPWDRIQYAYNDLRFDFAAPRFGSPTPIEYQYRLEGLDAEWSEWQANTNVVYSDLAEGPYTFRVRARVGTEVISDAAAFDFGVLPPWYRTWWAYGIYLVALAVGALAYRRYRRVVRENERAREQAKELERERLANERLQEANKRLKQANELKDNFLANTSHELRTPLTTILGFTDVLKDEAPPHHREFLDIIEKSGHRLLRTLNALLDLAKLRSGVVEADLERVNVADPARETIDMMAHEAERKGIGLELDAPDHPVYAQLDARYYEQVLDNLISNAIKFTDEGGVRVRIEATDEQVRIAVHDTGAGIDAAFIPYLFDDFKQESSGLDRDHGGSGLGLAITARLVELMGGTIDVESSKGEGSTFRVAFPRAQAPSDDPSPAQPARPEPAS